MKKIRFAEERNRTAQAAAEIAFVRGWQSPQRAESGALVSCLEEGRSRPTVVDLNAL